MKIIVKAKPGSKKDAVERIDDKNYVLYVKAPAAEGKANAAIVKLLADHFDVSQSLVEIISGYFAKTKVVQVHD